jgi:hypothetical protein
MRYASFGLPKKRGLAIDAQTESNDSDRRSSSNDIFILIIAILQAASQVVFPSFFQSHSRACATMRGFVFPNSGFSSRFSLEHGVSVFIS